MESCICSNFWKGNKIDIETLEGRYYVPSAGTHVFEITFESMHCQINLDLTKH